MVFAIHNSIKHWTNRNKIPIMYLNYGDDIKIILTEIDVTMYACMQAEFLYYSLIFYKKLTNFPSILNQNGRFQTSFLARQFFGMHRPFMVNMSNLI